MLQRPQNKKLSIEEMLFLLLPLKNKFLKDLNNKKARY
jgi:hypothetical protein